MGQKSHCAKCGANVEAKSISEDRAFFVCHWCKRRWSAKAFYGTDTSKHGTCAVIGGGIGAIVALGLTGGLSIGLAGGLLGASLGAAFGDGDTSTCIRCGGTGYVTGENRGRKGYQCAGCKRFWTQRT